jgi:1,4-dihydroxy-6-naphthoate synthase
VKIDRALRSSILWAQQNRGLCRTYVKKYAQELDDSIINEHIGLYVNSYSENLGEDGLAAVEFFLQKGCLTGLFPEYNEQPLIAPL